METYFSWDGLREVFRSHIERSFPRYLSPDAPHYAQTLAFALGRYEEGRLIADFFERMWPETRDVLDVGTGNGGVSLALANVKSLRVTSADIGVSEDLQPLLRETQLPVRQLVSDGRKLALASNQFDFVVCLETIEHVPQPRLMGAEIMRVLKPGGVCMITTPARLRHLFGPDPHYGIKRLLLFPNAIQRLIATKLLRRTKSYDVEHIFWSAAGIARMFPGGKLINVSWNDPFPGPTRYHNAVWYRLRNCLWDRLLIQKPG